MQAERRIINAARTILGVLVALLITACPVGKGCPTCPQPPPPTLPSPGGTGGTGGVTIPMCGSDVYEIAETIYEPAFAQTNLTPTVLFLSAGGSWGAWGAGILHEWLQETPPPKFDIVIGASTGALLGTFALLGDQTISLTSGGSISMLQALEDSYTKVNDADVFKQRSWFLIPFSNSINTLEPLRDLLEKVFTHEVIDVVGQIYTNEKRQLWVGTTNLDTGQFCNWNLSALAAKGKYEEYIDLLIASSANPGVFNPVFIPRNVKRKYQDMHADGGVRHQLYARVFDEAVRAYGDAHPTPSSPAPQPVAYAIVNGPLSVRKLCLEDHIVPVMIRGLSILQVAAMGGDLHAIHGVAENAAPPWELKTSFIPDTYELWPSPDRFREAEMKDLFDHAVTNGPAWYSGVPNFGASQAPCMEGSFPP